MPTAIEEAASTAKLSRKQRDLFLIVAKGRGKPVEHRKVYDFIWADDPNGGPEDARNVVSVMVRNTNDKLATTGYQIENVWGIGYRLRTIVPEVAS